MKQLPALAVFLGAVALAATLGGLFSPDEWYVALRKPSFQPPDWIFGPVWTGLYIAMALAGWLVWKESGLDGRTKDSLWPMTIFALQLILNALWPWMFFGLHSFGLSILVIGLLWLAILTMMAVFYTVSRPAGLLIAPYLLWVSFAGILNVSLWWLNRQPPS